MQTQPTTVAYRTETGASEKRIQFFAQRNATLSRDRNRLQERLDRLQADVRKIAAAVGAGNSSDIDKAIAIIERKKASEQRLMDDIARLTSKIGKA